MMEKHSRLSSAAVTVYLMYLLTGAACTVLGASLNSVMTQYGLSLSRAAGLASCLAIGRIATVFFSGMLTERIGSTRTLTIGVCAMLAYLALIPRLSSYPAAVMLAVIAGIGQGMQDSSCPVLLKRVFPDTYSSALGASQFFFGAGCFLPPAIMTFLLLNNLSWHWMYYAFGVLAVSIVSLVPFIPSSYNTRREEAGRSKTSRFGRELSEKGLMTFFLLCISIFTYCATTSIIHTYTPVYIMSFNIEEASAVSVLTIFSVGSMIGSLFFTWFLRKHEGIGLLWINPLVSLFFFTLCLLRARTSVFMFSFCVAGFFLGVLYSVFIAFMTEITPNHTAMAASCVALVGGSADVLAPVLTGLIEKGSGVYIAFNLALVLLLIMLAAGIGLKMRHRARVFAEKD